MKSLLVFFSIMLLTTAHASIPTINEKAVKNFTRAFPDAQQINWQEYGSLTEVRFEYANIKNAITYNLEGEITTTKRYYTESLLPLYIAAQVKEKYDGKKISGITEINNADGLNYYITLEGDTKWYNIQSDASGNLTLLDKFNKA